MEQTITPKFVRIAEFDRKDVNGDVVLDDNGNVIKDVKVLVRASEPVKYVTTNGEEVDLNDIAFFYNGVRAQLKGEHDASIYLGNVAKKCKDNNVSFTDAMTSLLARFKYNITVEEGKINLDSIELDDVTKAAIEKANDKMLDILA